MSLQGKIVKLLMKLPKGMLVGLAGGRPVTIGGAPSTPIFSFCPWRSATDADVGDGTR